MFLIRMDSYRIKQIRNFILIVIPVLLLTNSLYSWIYNIELRYNKSEFISYQREQLTLAEYAIGNLIENIYNDLNLIRRSDELNKFIAQGTTDNLGELNELLYRIAQSKPSFSQIRYLDISGNEIARTNQNHNKIEIVPELELQNKAERYYFTETMDLNEGEMYVSDFDLNIERGKVVIPYEPVVRFAIPIIHEGIKIGIIIINYDGYSILETLESTINESGKSVDLGIIDENYYWPIFDEYLNKTLLINQIVSSGKINTAEDINAAIKNSNHSDFRIDDTHYLYRNLDLTVGAESKKAENQWVVVSSFNFDDLINNSDFLIVKHPIMRSLFLTAVLLIVASLMVIRKQQLHRKFEEFMTHYLPTYTHNAIVVSNQNDHIIYCNSYFEDSMGYSLREIAGKNIKELFPIEKNLAQRTPKGSTLLWEGNIWLTTTQGSKLNYFFKMIVVKPFESILAYKIGILSDPISNSETENGTSQSKKGNQLLRRYNIPMIEAEAKDFMTSYEIGCVVVMKIEEFVNVRNQLSEQGLHHTVPMITKEIDKTLYHEHLILWPSSDHVIIFIERVPSGNDIEDLMKQLNDVIINLNFALELEKRISYSAGIALYPEHDLAPCPLIECAFAAIEAIPSKSHIRCLVYQKDMVDSVHLLKIMHDELTDAFDKNEFYVVYQMQYRVHDNQPTGVEALVRWKNSNLGNVSPNQFIPVLEESHLIKRLGIYVLKQVIEDFKNDINYLPKDFMISINLSIDELLDERVLQELLLYIYESGIDKRHFCFEITETTLISNLDAANEAINKIHDNHMITAIDDFGTGFSSLSYLKTLQTDKLKIDRLFIKDYPTFDDGTLLKGIVGIANDLNLTVIVEGIETAEQLDFIKELNCNEYQGFIASKPEPFEKCMQRLR